MHSLYGVREELSQGCVMMRLWEQALETAPSESLIKARER